MINARISLAANYFAHVVYAADGSYTLKPVSPEIEAQLSRIVDEAERDGRLVKRENAPENAKSSPTAKN